MADLKTTYKDDLLDTSVNEKRKYNMIQNADGTVSFEDVTTYSQIGDSFGASDINATNEKVNEVNSNLEIIRQTLSSGNTTLSFTDSRITADTVFDFYTSIYGVNPTEVVVSDTTLTLTFDSQDSDMEVGVRIYE